MEDTESPSEVGALSTLSDEELMKRVASERDARAFDVLYERVAPAMLARARRLCGDAAEDVMLEAMLKVWESAAKYDPERGRFRAWLMVILHRTAIDTIRRRSAREEAAGVLETGLGDDSAESAEQQWLSERRTERTQGLDSRVQDALETLHPEARALIEAHFIKGESLREIARSMGTTETVSRVRLHKVIRRLRSALAK